MDEAAQIILENILTRRSIRAFAPRVLPEEDIATILRAGDAAPSAGGLKSRKFICVTKQDDLDFILKYIFSRRVREHRHLFKNVPCIILICANFASALQKYKRGRLYATTDATLAGENMLLMAHALKIGSCWIGQIREKKIIERFAITAEYKLVGIIALGYQSTDPTFTPQ